MTEIILELAALLVALFCLIYISSRRRRFRSALPKGLAALKDRGTVYFAMLCANGASAAAAVAETAAKNLGAGEASGICCTRGISPLRSFSSLSSRCMPLSCFAAGNRAAGGRATAGRRWRCFASAASARRFSGFGRSGWRCSLKPSRCSAAWRSSSRTRIRRNAA